MREIKFRAWDKSKKEMFYITDLTFLFESETGIKATGYSSTEYQHDIIPENLVLLQYTGLKDKDGKDIYDGDLISRESHRVWLKNNKKVPNSEQVNTYAIEWSGEVFVVGWQLRKVNTTGTDKFDIGQVSNTSLHVFIKGSTIVGNIFETPELSKVAPTNQQPINRHC